MKYSVLSADMPSWTSVAPYLEIIHRSGHFTNFGKLESAYRSAIGAKLGVDAEQLATCSNATLAIQGICTIVGYPQWRVQNFTFPATGLAVQNAAKIIEFVDVDLDSWVVANNDFNGGSISTVPFGKQLSEFEFFETGFHIVDAAASLGNLDNLSKLKSNQAVVYSLHATKILGCGEGGLVVFGDHSLAAQFRSWTNFGFSGGRLSQVRASTNAKLSEIGCAYALANLREFPDKQDRYVQLRKKINSISRDFGILPEVMDDYRVSPYWIVQFESNEKRNLVEEKLYESGVETRRWWPKPLSQMSAFSCEQAERTAEINSSHIADTALGLPFHLKLSNLDFDEIASLLAKALV